MQTSSTGGSGVTPLSPPAVLPGPPEYYSGDTESADPAVDKPDQYVPLSAKDRFTALQTGDIDVLARNATWTLSRNTKLGINFVATNFYDGQAFMVKTASNIRSVNDLVSALNRAESDPVSLTVARGATTREVHASLRERET